MSPSITLSQVLVHACRVGRAVFLAETLQSPHSAILFEPRGCYPLGTPVVPVFIRLCTLLHHDQYISCAVYHTEPLRSTQLILALFWASLRVRMLDKLPSI